MKIGYPCINTSLQCTPNSTFRLSNYSETLMQETIGKNLRCLEETLAYNVAQGFLYFRIGSDLVPFASHPICTFPWQQRFADQFAVIGGYIKKHRLRISMHPDQFVVINSLKPDVVERSIKELLYHAQLLDLMGLPASAKIQIHTGGVYGNKESSILNFIKSFKALSPVVRRRLVLENDDTSYALRDCLYIHQETGVPVLFDAFHHGILNNGEPVKQSIAKSMKTWKKSDGKLMVDYSSQEAGMRKGTHAQTIDIQNFSNFIKQTRSYDFDLMLEIKDKEQSARAALTIIKNYH